jgi:hypothetical protein
MMLDQRDTTTPAPVSAWDIACPVVRSALRPLRSSLQRERGANDAIVSEGAAWATHGRRHA